ncbi:MAG: flavodoxin family protein, partial [Candidatus Hydrothermarchaeota archaeon]
MILGINGSPRKKGTLFLLSEALHAASEAGAETKLINLVDYDIKPCDACNKCVKEKACSISDDMEKIGEMLVEARAIIVGSPCYFSSLPALLKNFIDRTRILKMQGHRLKNKLFACVIT